MATNFTEITSAISAGAREDSFASAGSSLLMLGIIIILATTAIVVAKVRKEI